MRKIAIIAHGLNNGGAEKVASILANYFDERGYDVLYIAVYNDKKDYHLNDNIKVTYITARNKNVTYRFISRNKQICNILKSYNPKYVISFLTNETLLSVLSGFQVIYSLRNDPTRTDTGLIYRYMRSYLYERSKHVVFQTNGAQNYFSDTIKKKSSIIPNPLDVDKLPTWDSENHNKSFITACRLNKQKNLPLMIKAFAQFHIEHPDYSLEIYGEGELRDELQRLIDHLWASGYIHLMGRRNDIHQIMSKSFAFVLSSDYEGLSNSMLEALAIGIPCICTDCPPGGAREYITNNENGVLVPCGDVNAMCAGMQAVVESHELQERCKLASKALRRDLDFKNIGKLWEKIL